jgi:thioredoxin 1
MGFLKKLFGGEPKPGKPRTITDLEFEQEVLASDIPAVVDFWSSTCAPCQVMSGLLYELGPKYAGQINFFKLRVEQNPESATRYQIMSVPTLVFFRKGKMVDRIVGLMPMKPLRERLNKLAGVSGKP